MSAPQEVDGRPLREHLESIARQSGVTPDQLADAPDLPDGCQALWLDFLALHERRGMTGFGPAKITFGDVDAYQRVEGMAFERWERRCIFKADAAFFASLPKPKDS